MKCYRCHTECELRRLTDCATEHEYLVCQIFIIYHREQVANLGRGHLPQYRNLTNQLF